MPAISLRLLSYDAATADIHAVRKAVFQQEQGVDAAIDFDGLDPAADHIVVYASDQAIATARIRYVQPQLAKIERVAVLAAYRGQGIGRQIVEAAIAFLDEQGISETKVHAQTQVAVFYEKLGFKPQGEEFYEANIPHIEMRRIHPTLDGLN